MKKKVINVLIDKIGVEELKQATNTIKNKIIDSIQFAFEQFEEEASIDKIHALVIEIDGLRREDVVEGDIIGVSFTFTLDVELPESIDTIMDNDLEEVIIDTLNADTSGIECLGISICNPDCSKSKDID